MPDWPAAYIAGLKAGYWARCREQAEAWQDGSAQQVWVAGQFWERPTAAEQRHERHRILREGHEAGLHGGNHMPRECSLCWPEWASGPVMRRADLDAAERAIAEGRRERGVTP